MGDDSEPTDLLGDPLLPLPDKRGRRKLRFPAEVYEKVEVLAAAAMTHDEISDAVGISAPTLRKYFRQELDGALSRQRAEALSLLAEQARKGNVSAIKAYLAEVDKRWAAAGLEKRAKPGGANAVRKGKKEERQDAANNLVRGGSKYAPPPPPRLVN